VNCHFACQVSPSICALISTMYLVLDLNQAFSPLLAA
jgi:hypothetical protein